MQICPELGCYQRYLAFGYRSQAQQANEEADARRAAQRARQEDLMQEAVCHYVLDAVCYFYSGYMQATKHDLLNSECVLANIYIYIYIWLPLLEFVVLAAHTGDCKY